MRLAGLMTENGRSRDRGADGLPVCDPDDPATEEQAREFRRLSDETATDAARGETVSPVLESNLSAMLECMASSPQSVTASPLRSSVTHDEGVEAVQCSEDKPVEQELFDEEIAEPVDDTEPTDAPLSVDGPLQIEGGWPGHYAHSDPRALADSAAAEARTVRVERHAAVTELVQVLEASAATLLAPSEGMRHDRVDMMLSMPGLEGTTVALFVEDGRMIVEFSCASGAASQWLGTQARGMSEVLSARLRRPVMTRVQEAGGSASHTEEAASALPGEGHGIEAADAADAMRNA